jgi:hypothetical protein
LGLTLRRFVDWLKGVWTMLTVHGKKKPPRLAKVITDPSGDIDLLEGDTISATARGEDQYGNPFPITVTGWVSSDPAVCTVTGTDVATIQFGGTEGIAQVKPVNPAWPAGVQ